MRGLLRGVYGRLVGCVRRVERRLSPQDDWVEDDRRVLFEWLDRHFGHTGYPFTVEKGVADYVTTAYTDDDVVEAALDAHGFERNLTSSRKYRTAHSGGRQWANGSYVYDDASTDWQLHVYLFDVPVSQTADGYGAATDVYAHKEPSVRFPFRHLDPSTGVHGDPTGLVRGAFDASGITYERRAITDSNQ